MDRGLTTPNIAANLFQSVDFSVEPILSTGCGEYSDLGVEYKTPSRISTPISPSGTIGEAWSRIFDYASNWESAVTETNTTVSNAIALDIQITESLQQRKQEGSLSELEYLDLKYLSGLWRRLKICLTFYSVGTRVHKRELISILFELSKLQQLPESIVVDILARLC